MAQDDDDSTSELPKEKVRYGLLLGARCKRFHEKRDET